VQRLVRHEECVSVGEAALGGERRLHQPPELGDLGIRDGAGGLLGGEELERESDLVGVLDGRRRQRRDEVAAARLDDQQPFSDEASERVVDRAARDPEAGRQLVQAELLVRAVVAVEQALPEQGVDLLVQTLPLDLNDCDGVTCNMSAARRQAS
jgi:hypothetical protein